MKVKQYVKGILALIAATVVTVQTAITDDVITTAEWGVIVTSFVGAVSVIWFKNEPATPPA